MYNELLAEFKQWVSTDATVARYWYKNTKGLATYEDASKYAKLIGSKWSDYMIKTYGDKDYSDVADDIAKCFKKAYAESAYYSKNVQEGINKKSKIGMKAIEPHIDDYRLVNTIEKLVTDNAEFLLNKSVLSNFANSAVQDTIQANGRIQHEAGLKNYVARTSNGGCCSYCESLCGKYEYGAQPDEFWSVHKDCTCSFEYSVNKTHTKITYGSGRQKITANM